tara:strand:+ start:13420 stop:14805 length:1386 start_codon:yes stop_codon:yes gene_type:complete
MYRNSRFLPVKPKNKVNKPYVSLTSIYEAIPPSSNKQQTITTEIAPDYISNLNRLAQQEKSVKNTPVEVSEAQTLFGKMLPHQKRVMLEEMALHEHSASHNSQSAGTNDYKYGPSLIINPAPANITFRTINADTGTLQYSNLAGIMPTIVDTFYIPNQITTSVFNLNSYTNLKTLNGADTNYGAVSGWLQNDGVTPFPNITEINYSNCGLSATDWSSIVTQLNNNALNTGWTSTIETLNLSGNYTINSQTGFTNSVVPNLVSLNLANCSSTMASNANTNLNLSKLKFLNLSGYPKTGGSLLTFNFYNCTNLVTLIAPYVGSLVSFFGLKSLTAVDFSTANVIASINAYRCTSLTSLDLGKAKPNVVNAYGCGLTSFSMASAYMGSQFRVVIYDNALSGNDSGTDQLDILVQNANARNSVTPFTSIKTLSMAGTNGRITNPTTISTLNNLATAYAWTITYNA